MDALDLNCMAKLKAMTKTDYISRLLDIVEAYAHKCTVKQIKELIARYA